MARKHSTRRRTMKGGIWPFTSSTDAAATPEAPKRTWMQWLKGESADGSAPVPPSAVEQAAEPSPPPYGGRRRGTRKTKRSRSGKRSTRS